MTMFLAFGITFEVPVIVILLVKFGALTVEKLKEAWPYVIVGAFGAQPQRLASRRNWSRAVRRTESVHRHRRWTCAGRQHSTQATEDGAGVD
jgi:hypothetical protein